MMKERESGTDNDAASGTEFSPENSAAIQKLHGNTIHPNLHDKSSLEELVKRYGTATRIAQAVGCSRQSVDKALRRLHVKARKYVVSEEEEKRLKMT